jgi:CBS domain-containing protein
MRRSPAAASVGDVMRRRFIALAPTDSLLDAERVMRMARVRTLPVADHGALVGALSHREVMSHSLASAAGEADPRACGRWLRDTPVAALMQPQPRSVTRETALAEAAARLLADGAGCIPVVEAGGATPRLIGLLTETDLLRAAYER